VEKVFPGFQGSYDALCEYAHPNWAGVLGSFGRGDEARGALLLAERSDDPACEIGTNALAGSLLTFHHIYNELAEMIHRLNDHFEPQPGSGTSS
jgi:hypothetical protein